MNSPSHQDNPIFSLIQPKIADKLKEKGILNPTSVQSMTFHPILEGKDVIAQSRTGSGKTLAFGLPAFVKLEKPIAGAPRVLVLTPTRELATQVSDVYTELYQGLGFKTLAITGGSSYRFQITALQRGVDVVVATPGRLVDLLEQKKLSLGSIQILILDEMDEMLDFGFSEDILKIKEHIGKKVQTLLFSATFPPKVVRITKQIVENPVEIKVTANNDTEGLSKIEHEYILVRIQKNLDALLVLLIQHNPEHGIIFCKTREETKTIQAALLKKGVLAGVLNGEMTQQERTKTMDKFRKKEYKLLVATDVAARGIDIIGLSHVIHFNVPSNPEIYTHRAGRTGRAGASGKSWTIVALNQRREYQFISNHLRITPKLIEVVQASSFIHSYLEKSFEEMLSEKNAENLKFNKNVQESISKLSEDQMRQMLTIMVGRQMDKVLGEDFDVNQIFSSDKLNAPRPQGFGGPRNDSYNSSDRGRSSAPYRRERPSYSRTTSNDENNRPRNENRSFGKKTFHDKNKPNSNGGIQKTVYVERKPISFL